MSPAYTTISIRRTDADAADKVLGRMKIPKADRVGVLVRGFELLTDQQRMQALQGPANPAAHVAIGA